MPVSVQVPVKIVVDPQALMSRLDELDEAVEAATMRALTNAVAAIEERRGGYVTHRPADPVVSWRGDGLPDVPGERVGEAEALVRQALSRAVAATLPMARSDGDGSLAERLTADPSEIVDAQRLEAIAGLYALPGYEDGKDEVIPVDTPVTVDPPPTHLEWRRVSSRPEFLAAFGNATAGRGAHSGQLGAIFRDANPGVLIGVWQLPENTVVFPLTRYAEGEQLMPELDGTSTHVRRGPGGGYPAGASYRLRYLGPGQTEAERRSSLRIAQEDRFAPIIRERIHQLRPLATAAELDEEVDARVTQFINGVAASEAATTCYVELLVNGVSGVLASPHDVPDLDAELISIVEEVAGAAEEGAGGDGTGGDGTGGDGAGGDGAGGGTGAGAGDGTGDGTDDGGGGGPMLEATDGTGGSLFPDTSYAGGEHDCSPVNGEPALDDLGADGELLGRLIAQIAADLQIAVCPHAARFCLNAALAVQGRARLVGGYAVGSDTYTQTRAAVVGESGGAIVAGASPAMLRLRHLATVVPKINGLGQAIQRIYAKDEVFATIGGPWNDSPVNWNLHFAMELAPALTRSVGKLFVWTCQVVLLQSLRASAVAIAGRIASTTYLAALKKLILGFVMTVEDLDVLHDRLQSELDESMLRAAGRGLYSTWQEAKNGLRDALAGRDPLAASGEDEGEFVRSDTGVAVAIRDRHGNVWTLDELRSALASRRGIGLDIDPLVAQIVDDDEILGRFRRNPERIGDEISALLKEMKSRNEEITREVKSSEDAAFGYGRISENPDERTVPGTSVALSGIHLEAHKQIGEFFRGDPMYAVGLNRLFNAELGYQTLTTFVEVVGLTALAVLCPPAALAVGADVAVRHYAAAEEREHVFRALINPELVLTRADVETDLFLAELEAALVFLPVKVGPLLRGGSEAARTLAEGGILAGTRSLARRAGGGLSASASRALREATAAHVLQTIVVDQIEDKLLDVLVVQPVIAAVQQEFGAAPPAGSHVHGQATATRTLTRRGGSTGSTDATP